jgi:endonuclease/exonuclease/phosphatase family metal-dependent hydrolase
MDADLIAVQEVEPNQLGHEQVDKLINLLNKAAQHYETELYDYIIPEEYVGDEQVAFLWRNPVSLQSEPILLEHDSDLDNDGLRTFQRVPCVALFQATNYDFHVVNCHLYTKLAGTTSEGRGEEYKALRKWLQNLDSEQEKDAIVLGDFNRFLNGDEWHKLMTTNHANDYHFPLMEAIENEVSTFDPKDDDAPADKYSTTTSKSKRIYDQILISKGSYQEFTNSPQWDLDVGLIAFDNKTAFEWFIDSWHNAIRMLSDHRPVWIRMRIDLNDDD